MNGSWWVIIAAAALLLGGLFSSLFNALRESSRARLEELARSQGESPAARRLRAILDDIDGHAFAVSLPRTICNLVVVVAVLFAFLGSPGTGEVAITPSVWQFLGGLAVSTLLVWICGLVIPHGVAAHAGERTVNAWSRLVRACYASLRPLNSVVAFFDEVVRRLAGGEAAPGEASMQAEVLSAVQEAQEEGAFDLAEREMIEAVVEFRNTTVEQIMTPRTEMESMELTDNLGDITRFIKESTHSRIPVYEGSVDNIVGMFYIKDLMRWLAGDGAKGSGRVFTLRSILRPAIFVPETKTVRELLAELLQKNIHVAMVADEYGGTAGLVTIEDIVEEIFGEIRDEFEKEAEVTPEISVQAGLKQALIDARAYIDSTNASLRVIGASLPEGEDYDTVGGLIVTRLGRIPLRGESLRIGDAVLTIVEAEATRVSKVKLEWRPVSATPAPIGVEPAIVGAREARSSPERAER
jgi:putative hemolysin